MPQCLSKTFAERFEKNLKWYISTSDIDKNSKGFPTNG